MDHEVEAVDREPLRDAVVRSRGLPLAALVGEAPLLQMLDEGWLRFDARRREPFADFGRCIAELSTVLVDVSGIEIEERLDPSGRRVAVRCWRHLGHGGDSVCLPLGHAISLSREVVPGGEDLGAVRASWPDLPRWAREALRIEHPELRDLDASA